MNEITAIMIDSREPDWVKNLKFGGIPTMVTPLDTGDIQAVTSDDCTLVFERKTASDFLNTLKDDRLFPQMARMSELRNAQLYGESLNYWPYLIITGQFLPSADNKVVADGRATGWNFAAIQGTILSIQEMGVFVCFCNGDLDFENAILRIGKRDRKPQTNIISPRPAKVLGPKFDFLAGIQGIEVEYAQKILEWSGNNIAHALVGLVDMDIKAPVPLTIRRRLRDLLGLSEGETLEIALKGEITNSPVKGNLAELLKGQ